MPRNTPSGNYKQIRVERCKRGGDFVLRGRDGTRGVSGEGVRVSRIAFSLDSFRVDVLYYTRLYSYAFQVSWDWRRNHFRFSQESIVFYRERFRHGTFEDSSVHRESAWLCPGAGASNVARPNWVPDRASRLFWRTSSSYAYDSLIEMIPYEALSENSRGRAPRVLASTRCSKPL